MNPRLNCLKLFLVCLIFSFAAVFPESVKAKFKISGNVHRIVFLGNSITYLGQYVTDVEAFLVAKYPKRHFEIINTGLPSETVSGLSEDGHAKGQFPRPDLHERLARVLKMTRPDLVFASYGMNDAIYLPLDSVRFQKYKDGINWLHTEVIKSGARIVHLTPPVFDEKQWPVKGYSGVLDVYAKWLLDQRKAQKWDVADVHFPMQKALETYRAADPNFYFAKDGVHPGDLGHWVMAKQILLFLGEDEVAGAQSINEALARFANGEEILKLVAQRQTVTKDAWLTAIGHKRPGMKQGISLDSAKTSSIAIGQKIHSLRKHSGEIR
jgi:lysophospholipase L1-like esterase